MNSWKSKCLQKILKCCKIFTNKLQRMKSNVTWQLAELEKSKRARYKSWFIHLSVYGNFWHFSVIRTNPFNKHEILLTPKRGVDCWTFQLFKLIHKFLNETGSNNLLIISIKLFIWMFLSLKVSKYISVNIFLRG